MTRGQQLILIVLVLMVLGVTALLAITLINSDEDTSPTAPQAVTTATTVPTMRPLVGTATAITVPPTWTPLPTRTAPATNTPGPTHTATAPPTITPTFMPTFTPKPTEVVTPSEASPTATLALQNPGFEGIADDIIPGWSWWAEDNFTAGGDYDPNTSFDTPLFKQADDPVRLINGPTLQIDATQHVKFNVYVYQTVPVSPTTKVGFQVMAGAFSDTGAIQLAAGIVPGGSEDCNNARWSDLLLLDQRGGVQPIVAPEVTAGSSGQVTLCIYAEPLYAAVSNAAFFDDAELTLTSE